MIQQILNITKKVYELQKLKNIEYQYLQESKKCLFACVNMLTSRLNGSCNYKYF
jgi:hypothetical protein